MVASAQSLSGGTTMTTTQPLTPAAQLAQTLLKVTRTQETPDPYEDAIKALDETIAGAGYTADDAAAVDYWYDTRDELKRLREADEDLADRGRRS